MRLVRHNALETDHAAIEADINVQPRSRRLASTPGQKRCPTLADDSYFVFPEASVQTGGSGTTLRHRKPQSDLGSAGP